MCRPSSWAACSRHCPANLARAPIGRQARAPSRLKLLRAPLRGARASALPPEEAPRARPCWCSTPCRRCCSGTPHRCRQRPARLARCSLVRGGEPRPRRPGHAVAGAAGPRGEPLGRAGGAACGTPGPTAAPSKWGPRPVRPRLRRCALTRAGAAGHARRVGGRGGAPAGGGHAGRPRPRRRVRGPAPGRRRAGRQPEAALGCCPPPPRGSYGAHAARARLLPIGADPTAPRCDRARACGDRTVLCVARRRPRAIPCGTGGPERGRRAPAWCAGCQRGADSVLAHSANTVCVRAQASAQTAPCCPRPGPCGPACG